MPSTQIIGLTRKEAFWEDSPNIIMQSTNAWQCPPVLKRGGGRARFHEDLVLLRDPSKAHLAQDLTWPSSHSTSLPKCPHTFPVANFVGLVLPEAPWLLFSTPNARGQARVKCLLPTVLLCDLRQVPSPL